MKNDHHSKFSNLGNWKEEAWKDIYQAFNGIRSRDLREILVRRSSNWAMKPHIGSEVIFLTSYLPVRSEMMWSAHGIIDIWTAVVVESEEWSSQEIF